MKTVSLYYPQPQKFYNTSISQNTENYSSCKSTYGWWPVSRLCGWHIHFRGGGLTNTVESRARRQATGILALKIRLNKIYNFSHMQEMIPLAFCCCFVKQHRNCYTRWLSFRCQKFRNSSGPQGAVQKQKKQKSTNSPEVVN